MSNNISSNFKNSTPISVSETDLETLKNKLYDDLCRGILEAMMHGQATIQDGKESARFILDHLDKVKTKDELLQFLFDLATRWKVYHPFYIKAKYTLEEEKDKEKIEKLKEHLYQFIKTQ